MRSLETAGLISRDKRSDELYTIYVVDKNLMSDDFSEELHALFGSAFDDLALNRRKVLAIIYRYNNFNTKKVVNARQIAKALWNAESLEGSNITSFENYNRSMRTTFNHLEERGFISRAVVQSAAGYVLADRSKNSQI